MTLGFTSPLYLLPLDHRHSYVTGMFQFTTPLTADEHNIVAESKRVIYDGFRQALGEGVPTPRAGILVDEEFGANMSWLDTAAAVPGFIGFAVGRTTFWDAVADDEAHRVTRQEAVIRVAHRYREWATICERTHPVPKLKTPRAIWMMIPGVFVEQLIADLLPHLEPGDILIDGGNSYYVDDIRLAKELAVRQIHYVDCGTSGGVMGLERGYCLMIGGPTEAVQRLEPVFRTLAPGAGDIPRTPGRDTLGGTAEQGYLHCGPSGGIEQLINQILLDADVSIQHVTQEGVGERRPLMQQPTSCRSTTIIAHGDVAVAVDIRNGWPAKQPSPKTWPT